MLAGRSTAEPLSRRWRSRGRTDYARGERTPEQFSVFSEGWVCLPLRRWRPPRVGRDGDNADMDELAVGWDALRRGRWDAARAIFEHATRGEESAEGFEGLSWAAWWHDDAAAVFAARERAYALYKQRGDRAGAARMATWLAADELDFNGAVSISRSGTPKRRPSRAASAARSPAAALSPRKRAT